MSRFALVLESLRTRAALRRLILPGLLVLVAIGVGAPEIHVPLGLDQGILTYIGNDILDGGIPYATSWDHKPPGAYFVSALGLALFGRTVEGFRELDLAYVCALALVLYALGARLFDRLTGFIAALVFVAHYYRLGWWDEAQPDGYMLAPMLAALLLMTMPRAERKLGHELGAGACLGFAFITKFVSLAALLPLGFWLALEFFETRAWLRASLALAGGFLAINLALVLYLWHGHGLLNFIESQTVFNRGYVLQGHRGDPSTIFVARDLFHPVVALPLTYFAIACFVVPAPALIAMRQRFDLRLRSFVFTLLLLAGLALEIIAQAKFYPYHFTPLLVPLGIFAGVGVSIVSRLVALLLARNARLMRYVPALVAAGFLYAMLKPVAHERLARYRELVRFREGRENPRAYYSQFGGYGDGGGFSYLACLRAAEYVRAHSDRSERIYVWGFDPLLPFLAERKLVSRFTYNTPLIVRWGRPAWRKEFLAALEAAPPKFFLVLHNDQHHWTTGRTSDSYALFQRDFPELKAFVRAHYRRRHALEDYEIFQRKK